ncbi:MAG: TatD family hydrolase [Oleiphilaceae bacterium]|nr:TatD family hydrolase [Oleiphilaceae bacterium]
MYIDSHCHLDRLKLDTYNGDLNKALDEARDRGVSQMLCVAIDLEHIDDVLGIAETHDDIFASVGVHPGSDNVEEPSVDRLLELADHPKVIAIGETGLDYYYGSENKAEQQVRFQTHLEASRQCKKPVIVHTRDAKEDTLALIKKHGDPDVGGVLHCFTEDLDMAKRAIDMNYYVSFSGIVTFKNAVELKEVATALPLDRILIETDSPYLAPVPFRGKPNEPKYVKEVCEYIAELKQISPEQVAHETSCNFRRLFNVVG